jgi:regulator of cell morphogenesis and NO signaling
MATISGDMVINEVIKKYPATIKVFNDYRVDSCCGGGAPIEVTARRDGVDVDGLVRALNAAVEGPQAGAALKR